MVHIEEDWEVFGGSDEGVGAWDDDDDKLNIDFLHVDSDCAKGLTKPTSGGVMVISGAVVKHWPRTQARLALSTAESQSYAMVTGAAELLGVQSLVIWSAVSQLILRLNDLVARPLSLSRFLVSFQFLQVPLVTATVTQFVLQSLLCLLFLGVPMPHLRQLLNAIVIVGLRLKAEVRTWTDSNTAKATASTRAWQKHGATSLAYVWMQQMTKSGIVKIKRVLGKSNLADHCTKGR